MDNSELFSKLVKKAKSFKRGHGAFPEVRIGPSWTTLVKQACKSLKEEAEFWGAEVFFSNEMIAHATEYLSKTDGELPLVATWDEWKRFNRFVIKGQKATSWKDGNAQFGWWQVTTRSYAPRYSSDWNDDFTCPSSRCHDEPTSPEPETVYYADGSGYVNFGGPGGPLYFDRNGNS